MYIDITILTITYKVIIIPATCIIYTHTYKTHYHTQHCISTYVRTYREHCVTGSSCQEQSGSFQPPYWHQRTHWRGSLPPTGQSSAGPSLHPGTGWCPQHCWMPTPSFGRPLALDHMCCNTWQGPCRQANRHHADRQTDTMQTGRQTPCRLADRQTDTVQTGRQTPCRQADRHHADRQIDCKINTVNELHFWSLLGDVYIHTSEYTFSFHFFVC